MARGECTERFDLSLSRFHHFAWVIMEIILIVFAIAGALFGLWMMLHAIYGLFRH